MLLTTFMLARMREAAYWRHYAVWLACGGNPNTWSWHVAAITAVYGW